jgi:hypothetical protein
MKIIIMTAQKQPITKFVNTPLEKAELGEGIAEELKNDNLDFGKAYLHAESGTIEQANSLEEFIEILGKFGV